MTSGAEPANFSTATARRLPEIARRNENSPGGRFASAFDCEGIAPDEESGKIGGVERFEAAFGEAVWEKVLKQRREAEGNPNWRPSWMEGVGYQSEVYKILRERFAAAGR